jgi:O-antigen ligase
MLETPAVKDGKRMHDHPHRSASRLSLLERIAARWPGRGAHVSEESWVPRSASGRRSASGKVVLRVRPAGSRQAARMLQVFIVCFFVLPTDTVLRVIGAQGYVAGLVSMAIFLAWVLTAVFGFHDPVHTRHPTRGALGLLWISTLLSYAAMPYFSPTAAQRLSAQRWLMLLVGMTGVILVAAEHLRAPSDVLRVVRTLVWGGAFSGIVALMQFWLGFDLRPTLRMLLPGFTFTGDYTGFQGRGALMRVSGTSNHPIELGVIAGMLLPVAIWLAFYDTDRPLWKRLTPILLIGLCIPMSVSRSAILAAGVSMIVLTICLPPKQRVWILGAAPFGIVGIFGSTPGYMRTILDSFTTGASATDPSITNRLDNYPRVIAFVEAAPWLGRGWGTYLAPDATRILDNQYLKSAIESGLFGVLALLLFFLVPALTAAGARARSTEPNMRGLCAALSGACLAAAIGSYTFDSFSFPQFASVEAMVVGLCGACWLGVRRWPHGLAREGDSPILTAPRARTAGSAALLPELSL